MDRWVGTKINFDEPQVSKITIKPSKKNNYSESKLKSRLVSVPAIIESQTDPSKDKSYEYQIDARFKNQGEKFIMMDGKRKVGRQRIPSEFYQREESLKRAALVGKSENTQTQTINRLRNIGSQLAVNDRTFKEFQNAIDEKHKSPSLNKYPDRNSLPYSSSLRALANQSVAILQTEDKRRSIQDFDRNMHKELYQRNNSTIL